MRRLPPSIPQPHAKILFISLILVVLATFGASPVFAHDGIHVVKPGETLSQIAKEYGTTVAVLRDLNDLGDTNFIWYGQRLVLPADSRAVQPAESAVDGAALYYVVQPGDTLSGIANAYSMGLAQLVAMNQISPAQRLYVGQRIQVPAAQAATADSERSTVVNADGLPVHTVQAGEYLGTIAALYATTPRAIAQANHLADPSLLVPGQRLVIAPPSQAEKAAMSTAVGADGYHVHTEFPTTTEKWIDVDLSEQRVVAYEGTEPVKAFIISSGLPGTPTVTGTFRIWAKTPIQDMYGGNRAAGNYYYLPDVQWVQYFYQDYSFHGTYWHNNFGQPMSRGCINMRNEDAKWLFQWASPKMEGAGWLISDDDHPGTLVLVHR